MIESSSCKRFFRGTHRICSPEQTWAKLAGSLPKLGISRVADVTGLDTLGIPVAQAIRPTSRTLAVSQGKGLTLAAAKVSAVMESTELLHAECLEALPQTVAPREAMEQVNPFPAHALPWRGQSAGVHGFEIPWLRSTSLADGTIAWLPRGMVELDFTLRPGVASLFDVSSNGLASGNSPAEARLHGVCELVERHALHRLRQVPQERRALCLDSLVDEECRALVRSFRRAGFKLAVFDISWAGIPVFSAVAAAPDRPGLWPGSGSHPCPRVAFCRAVTEAAQTRLAFISGARDDLPEPPEGFDPVDSFDDFDEPRGELRLSEVADLSTPTMDGDLEQVVNRLAGLGHPIFSVDLSPGAGPRGIEGLSIVKVWAPGLKVAFHD